MKVETTGGEKYIVHFGGRHSGDVKIVWHNRYQFVYQSDYNVLIITTNQKFNKDV